VCAEVARLLGVSTVLLARERGVIETVGASPPGPLLGSLDIAAADWAFDRGEMTGRDSGTLTASDWQFHPLETALGVLGVLGVARQRGGDPVPADKRVLFTTLLGQAALAHERLKLEANAREVGALQQRDDLRATLLSSIGHDLKTPLTAVVAAADELATVHGESATAATLKSQARRLRRVFDDLVEMTRIEAGALDAVAAAAQDLRAELAGHPLVLDVPPTLPLVDADPRLLHHILINLLGNAAKFSQPGSAITVQARRVPDHLVLAVLDAGPGLPAGFENTLFDRFTRVDGDDRSGGTGLGLAIVKGFAQAMALGVSARNRPEGGSAFEVKWPESQIRRPPN